MGIESIFSSLAFGWVLGSVVLLLAVLYFTRVLNPIEESWEENICETCGRMTKTEEIRGMDICDSCKRVLFP